MNAKHLAHCSVYQAFIIDLNFRKNFTEVQLTYNIIFHVFNVMIQHLHTLPNDHNKSSYHLLPYKII